MIPYFGVFPFVLRARKRAWGDFSPSEDGGEAFMKWKTHQTEKWRWYSVCSGDQILGPKITLTFSAPRIWTVDAGHLANDVKDPAFEIRRAPTVSPIRAARLGATTPICIRGSKRAPPTSGRCSFSLAKYALKAIRKLLNNNIYRYTCCKKRTGIQLVLKATRPASVRTRIRSKWDILYYLSFWGSRQWNRRKKDWKSHLVYKISVQVSSVFRKFHHAFTKSNNVGHVHGGCIHPHRSSRRLQDSTSELFVHNNLVEARKTIFVECSPILKIRRAPQLKSKYKRPSWWLFWDIRVCW